MLTWNDIGCPSDVLNPEKTSSHSVIGCGWKAATSFSQINNVKVAKVDQD